jgi:hypothetical protein
MFYLTSRLGMHSLMEVASCYDLESAWRINMGLSGAPFVVVNV